MLDKLWEFKLELDNILIYHSPSECPKDKKFVPPSLRSRLIIWDHMAPASGHPGMLKPLQLLIEKDFWQTMAQDINTFISSCSKFAQAKIPTQNS